MRPSPYHPVGQALFILYLLSFVFTGVSAGQEPSTRRNYFLSASGNDNNDGYTPATAWRTIEKLNEIHFNAGDTIFLQGGNTFTGTIRIGKDDNGSYEQPFVITSFGKGKATIDAGTAEGLLAVNSSNTKIISLVFKGNGVDNNKVSGIHFYSTDSASAPGNIQVIDCEVSGFHNAGIVFGAHESTSVFGYQHVKILHCNATENGNAGISSYGSQLAFQHRNFYIAYCKAFRNHGIPSKKKGHSGNGIVMAQVNDILIEHCEAYENGMHNQSTEGGPVGIWVWMCKGAVIQYCSSHDNYAGFTKDGGGFDIDGGSSGCIIQNNFSYNNEGAGYLLAEFGAQFPFEDNIIRFNVSVNDARKNGYGAITVWGSSPVHRVTRSVVHNNTIYLDDRNIINGMPAVINFMGSNFSDVLITNNVFVTKGNVLMVTRDTSFNTSAARLINNNYYSYDRNYKINWSDRQFNSLQGWLKNDGQQEKLDGKNTAMSYDPLFLQPKALQDTHVKHLGAIQNNVFSLQKNSPLRKMKFDMKKHVPLYSNMKDFCNQDLPAEGLIIAGACIH